MTRTEFEQLATELETIYREERRVKGNDYAKPDEDVLSNFKEVAFRLNGAPLDALTVWAVYFEKQVTAIERYIRDRSLSSESIQSRFQDVHNYGMLGMGLIRETAQAPDGKIDYAVREEEPEPTQVKSLGLINFFTGKH